MKILHAADRLATDGQTFLLARDGGSTLFFWPGHETRCENKKDVRNKFRHEVERAGIRYLFLGKTDAIFDRSVFGLSATGRSAPIIPRSRSTVPTHFAETKKRTKRRFGTRMLCRTLF